MGVLGDQKEGIFLFLHNKKTVEDIYLLLFFTYIGIIPITIPVINITIVVPTAHNKVNR